VSEDFPDPETPVTTINLFRGISTEMFFKLCTLAPLINILSEDLGTGLAWVLAFVDVAIILRIQIYCITVLFVNSFFNGYWVKKSKNCLKFAFFEKVSIFSW
jgi:hypothetical protein